MLPELFGAGSCEKMSCMYAEAAGLKLPVAIALDRAVQLLLLSNVTHTLSAKFPCSIPAVGSLPLNVEYVITRRNSCEKKKNVCCLMMGPPSVYPKSLYRSGGLFIFEALLKKLFAFSTSLRKNSY